MFRISMSGSEEYKLVILVRNDLKMTKGKIAAQLGHASVNCALSSKKNHTKQFDGWMNSAQTKIVLRGDTEEEIFQFKAAADAQGINNSVIADAGRTQIEPGSITCLGIGPEKVSVLDKMTGGLKML